MKRIYAGICLSISLLFSCQQKAPGFESLSVENFRSLIDDPAVQRLDVRTTAEYTEGHIPGSRNVPLQDISGSQPIPAGKSTPLYVYCYSGARSAQAAGALRRYRELFTREQMINKCLNLYRYER